MKDRATWAARLVLAGGVAGLAACSMATSIQRNALEYNASVATYNDHMLMYTVLRARDEAPINILALSTINGAVSVQGTLAGTNGYENIAGVGEAHNFTAAVAPAIQASSSPTWSMASLDTQGFMLGIVQPISPMYVVSKWSTGLDREFLLRLFIKSINLKDEHGYHEYLNNPDSPAAMAQFTARLHGWLPHMHMRALTVLEPLGPAFDPAPVTSVSTTWDNTKKPALESKVEKTESGSSTAASLLGAYEHLMPLVNGPFQVGNAPAAAPGGKLNLQLYREYPQQVVLCVPRGGLSTEPVTSSSAPLGVIEQEEESAMSAYALALKSAAKGGAGSPPSGTQSSTSPTSGTAATAGGTTPHPANPASLSTNLKLDRVAAILPLGACGQDELVLPPYTEEQNAKNSGTYSHVEWRSIAEVIQYLGALLRASDQANAVTWDESAADGSTITHTLFELQSNAKGGFASIDYRGASYTLSTNADHHSSGSRDHSMEALSILNELVSTAKVSSDIPNTQAIQILP